MAHDLTFDTLVYYDAGIPGISIDVELRIGESVISVTAKVEHFLKGMLRQPWIRD